MKPTTKNDKTELAYLQKENTSLRSQLKALGTRLNDLIDQKDSQKGKKIGLNVNPEDELREVNKLIEILKKEKEFLSKRLNKVLDLNYFNTLSLKVENDLKLLNSNKNLQKVAELFEKKENVYKQSTVKASEKSDFDSLNSKRHYLIVNIDKLKEKLERNSEMIEENNKTVNGLEEERKRLLNTLGEPFLREKSIKQMMERMKKKKKIEKSMQRETNSKVNAMLIKIKSLQAELKELKDSENRMNSKILNTSMQVQVHNEKIRLSPIGTYTKKSEEIRSHSVKPKLYKSFLVNF